MCDYSLHSVASRPAQVGDNLVVTRFRNSETRGFSAVGEPDVAVCLMPGTEVAFERNAVRDTMFSWLFPNRRQGRIGEKMARFRHINENMPNHHHDALEFPNGKVVLLTKLRRGQRATVLQLPAQQSRSPEHPTEQRPAANALA